MGWSDLLSLGISAYSAKQSTDAAEDAADAKIESSQDVIDFSKWLYETQTELQKPYYDVGISTLPMLQARAGVIDSGMQKPTLQKIPNYTADQAAGIDNIYDYVANLYVDGLGKEGSPQNIENWVEKIATGQLNKNSVVDEFMKEADANNIAYDKNKLSGIQNSINAGISQIGLPNGTSNYLNSFNSPQDRGGDNSDSNVNTSSMGSTSSLGSFSFSGVSDFLGQHGYKTSKAIGAINPIMGLAIGAITFGAGLYDDYKYEEDMAKADEEYMNTNALTQVQAGEGGNSADESSDMSSSNNPSGGYGASGYGSDVGGFGGGM